MRQHSLWTAPRYFSQVHVGMQDSQSVRTSYQTNRSNKSLKTDINNQKKIHCALENTALVCPIRHAAVAQWPNNNNTTAKSSPKSSTLAPSSLFTPQGDPWTLVEFQAIFLTSI